MAAGSWSRIGAEEAQQFVEDTLLATSRTLPVVAVTTSAKTQQPWIDPESLAAELDGRALIVLLETGDATWALGAALPKRLDVYGGAVRIWWPGLTRESDPFDHVLLLIHHEGEAATARERILSAIRGGDVAAGRSGSTAPQDAPRSTARARRDSSVVHAATSEAWRRIAEEYEVGDVVPARVFRLGPSFALVELLPGAGVIVPRAEIDYTWVRDPAEVLTVGERVNVELLELDPDARRGLASIKRALFATPREGISMRPGEAPYLDAASVEETNAQQRRALQREREVNRKLAEELEATIDDRQRLAQQCEAQRQQAVAARKELRSAESRIQSLEARIAAELDPLAAESHFLAAVRVEHARRFDEVDRLRYPLLKMRVGRSFLASLRNLQGVDTEKVVEVCAQVACGRAHEIFGRAVHELGEGAGGRGVVRAIDGAKAWRCALQIASPSARRLHWWSIPEKSGPTIEFASVAVHDDFSIPG